jgi:hypothetical protein
MQEKQPVASNRPTLNSKHQLTLCTPYKETLKEVNPIEDFVIIEDKAQDSQPIVSGGRCLSNDKQDKRRKTIIKKYPNLDCSRSISAVKSHRKQVPNHHDSSSSESSEYESSNEDKMASPLLNNKKKSIIIPPQKPYSRTSIKSSSDIHQSFVPPNGDNTNHSKSIQLESMNMITPQSLAALNGKSSISHLQKPIKLNAATTPPAVLSTLTNEEQEIHHMENNSINQKNFYDKNFGNQKFALHPKLNTLLGSKNNLKLPSTTSAVQVEEAVQLPSKEVKQNSKQALEPRGLFRAAKAEESSITQTHLLSLKEQLSPEKGGKVFLKRKFVS